MCACDVHEDEENALARLEGVEGVGRGNLAHQQGTQAEAQERVGLPVPAIGPGSQLPNAEAPNGSAIREGDVGTYLRYSYGSFSVVEPNLFFPLRTRI